MAYIVPPRDVVHIDGLTVGKMLDLYLETPGTGIPEPILRYSMPKLCFPCTYVLNNPKQRKKSIGQPSYGESYRGRSTGPPSRVSPDTDHRSVGNPGKLARLPNICVQV